MHAPAPALSARHNKKTARFPMETAPPEIQTYFTPNDGSRAPRLIEPHPLTLS